MPSGRIGMDVGLDLKPKDTDKPFDTVVNQIVHSLERLGPARAKDAPNWEKVPQSEPKGPPSATNTTEDPMFTSKGDILPPPDGF